MGMEATPADQIRSYAARWRLVEEEEIDELRAMTPAAKLVQTAAWMESAIALGWQTTDPLETAAVRNTWRRLKRLAP